MWVNVMYGIFLYEINLKSRINMYFLLKNKSLLIPANEIIS